MRINWVSILLLIGAIGLLFMDINIANKVVGFLSLIVVAFILNAQPKDEE